MENNININNNNNNNNNKVLSVNDLDLKQHSLLFKHMYSFTNISLKYSYKVLRMNSSIKMRMREPLEIT